MNGLVKAKQGKMAVVVSDSTKELIRSGVSELRWDSDSSHQRTIFSYTLFILSYCLLISLILSPSFLEALFLAASAGFRTSRSYASCSSWRLPSSSAARAIKFGSFGFLCSNRYCSMPKTD